VAHNPCDDVSAQVVAVSRPPAGSHEQEVFWSDWVTGLDHRCQEESSVEPNRSLLGSCEAPESEPASTTIHQHTPLTDAVDVPSHHNNDVRRHPEPSHGGTALTEQDPIETIGRLGPG
jgi:hypothetical protein